MRGSPGVPTLGLFIPGDSLVHRLPAGAKLAGLLVAGAATVLVDSPTAALAAVAVALAGYLVAGLGPRVALAQLRPLALIAALVLPVHVLLSGWERAVMVAGVVGSMVLLAALVTLTTRTTALVDVVVAALRPLRRLGVSPDRVGLVVLLGIRCVPVVAGLAAQVREAQVARGLEASPRAFAVPLLVRALRYADSLGEALDARGAGD